MEDEAAMAMTGTIEAAVAEVEAEVDSEVALETDLLQDDTLMTMIDVEGTLVIEEAGLKMTEEEISVERDLVAVQLLVQDLALAPFRHLQGGVDDHSHTHAHLRHDHVAMEVDAAPHRHLEDDQRVQPQDPLDPDPDLDLCHALHLEHVVVNAHHLVLLQDQYHPSLDRGELLAVEVVASRQGVDKEFQGRLLLLLDGDE